jgi:squalene-hopene/tetraprenyl-beta-curcumene cyclase
VAAHDPAVQTAASWLLNAQRESGGWGGSLSDYGTIHESIADHESIAEQGQVRGLGLESISLIHTAWALLALVAAGHGDSAAVHRGVQFLRGHHQPSGNWGRDDLAVGYRASTDCGNEPWGAVHYPLLALTEWLCRRPASAAAALRI